MAQMLNFASIVQNIQIPANIQPLVVSIPPPPKLEGPLAPNNWLSKVRTHANGKVLGPESMVVYKGYVYTGQADGWVVEVSPKGSVRKIARMSLRTCGRKGAGEGDCGRPMGIRLDNNGYLVVADAYNGLIRVNPRTGDPKRLINSRTLKVNGRPLGYLNDLTIARDGRIFFSSSSSKWTLAKQSNIVFEAENTGRVLVYDPREKSPENQVRELITNLTFPNGLQLSKDEEYLLVAEGTRSRILRAWIGPTSPKQNTIEDFATNLPGIVDNIRLSPRGTLWVGMSQARHHDLPTVLDNFGDQPRLRAILIMLVNNKVQFSNPRFGIVVELDGEGRVVRSLQDPMGWRFNSVSEVEEDNGILYFASRGRRSLGYIGLKSLAAESNTSSILHHPIVAEFLHDVRNNMLKMTDRRIKEAVLDLLKMILLAREHLMTLEALIAQREQTVARLREIIRQGGHNGGHGQGETTTCGHCGHVTTTPEVTTTATPSPGSSASAPPTSGGQGAVTTAAGFDAGAWTRR